MLSGSCNRPSPQRSLAWVLILILPITSLLFMLACSPVASTDTAVPEAGIIDQLHSLQPNEAFITEVTQQLNDYGFEVELYQSDEVTVDLYRELPATGYKLIVFRAHAGLLGREGEISSSLSSDNSLRTAMRIKPDWASVHRMPPTDVLERDTILIAGRNDRQDHEPREMAVAVSLQVL